MTIRRILRRLSPLPGDSRGATAVEYGLIAALIVVVMIAALKGMAGSSTGMWDGINRDVQAASRP